MAKVKQDAILNAVIEGIKRELNPKTSVEQVYIDDEITVAEKLKEIIAVLNASPTTEMMNTAIKNAVDSIIDKAPEEYNTLKKIADYIQGEKDYYTKDEIDDMLANLQPASEYSLMGISDSAVVQSIENKNINVTEIMDLSLNCIMDGLADTATQV